MIYDSNPAFCKFCVNSELLTPVEVPSYAMLCLAMVRVIFSKLYVLTTWAFLKGTTWGI